MLPKYRAWDKKGKMMYAVDVIDFGLKRVGVFPGKRLIPLEFKNIELLQYTGLKDCNGVEIYEDDYIRHYELENNPSLVGMDCGCWFAEGMESFPEKAYRYEVIGNKFENPELLEAGE